MARKKRSKIRRYGNIYGRGMGSGSWHIILAMVAGVLLCGVIGWSLYNPIHDWISGLGEERTPPSSSTPAVAPPSSSTGELALPSDQTSQPNAVAPPVSQGEIQGIYLPTLALSDTSVFTGFLARASTVGLNTVVLEAKDATGTVLFHSQHALAQKLGAAAVTAYDPDVAVKMIRDAGFVPAARLHAFRDSLTPIEERGLGVRYYDTSSLWYDNAPEQGGKAWLNPCSDEAQQYIISLASELVKQGFEIIFLDSVQFPSGYGLEKAGFGVLSPDRAKVLDDFIAKVQKAVQDAGGQLILCLPDDVLTTGNEENDLVLAQQNQLVYGGNPAARATGTVMVSLSNDPAVSKQILNRARAQGPDAQWIGLLPAYHSDGSLIASSALLTGLDSAGYLLYNPQGNYQLQ